MKGTISTWLSHTYHEGRVLFGPEFFLLIVVAVYVAAIASNTDERLFPAVLFFMILPFGFIGAVINIFRLGRLSLPRRIALWLLVIIDSILIFLFAWFLRAFSLW